MYALVDPATRRNLDAAVVRADTADIGNAENDVYQQLIGMLNVELGSEKQLKTDSSTAPSKAYQYYVRGRGYLWDYQDPQNLNHAIALFQSAIDADPKFASAYAALGEAFWRRYEETKDPQWATEAITACDRAKELNPELSSVHTTLGLIYHGTGKDSEAVKSFEEALRLEATNDTASRGLGATYQSLGKFKQAEETYRHAIEIRPDYWGGYLDLGIFFYKRGQLDQAAEQFRKVIQLVPDNVRAYDDL
jgi:tetratricopeptide (TPR) repeat protein